MSMRKVTAIIRCDALKGVEQALQTLGVEGLTITHVMGFGEYADPSRHDWLVEHARIEIFATADCAEAIVACIAEAAHTGTPGDGIIAVLPVERLVRIREHVSPAG